MTDAPPELDSFDARPEGTRSSLSAASLGRQRTRKLVSGILASFVSRGASAVAPILLIPITLPYLGAKLYGLWMAVAALASMALWADLGLGNGLLTKLAACYSSADWKLARKNVSTAYGVLFPVAGLLTALLWFTADLISWPDLFNVTDPEIKSVSRTVVLITLSAFLINVPLSLVQRVQYAYQRVAQSNIWQSSGSLLSLGLAWTAVASRLDPTVVVGAAVSGPLLSNIAQSIWVYTKWAYRLRPRLKAIDRTVVLSLCRLGGQFFVLSVITSIALNVDNLIIARSLGLAVVTEYAVPAKMFMTLGLIVTLVNLPLWPANGEALARGDYSWVRKMTVRMTVISGAAVVLPATVLLLVGDRILTSWLNANPGSASLFLGFAFWWVLLATASPLFMVQNAAGFLRPQFVGWILYLALSVPAKFLAAEAYGLVGVVFTGVIGYGLLVWPAALVGYLKTVAPPTLTLSQMKRP